MAETTPQPGVPQGLADALPPAQMARRAVDAGAAKARLGLVDTGALAVLAGAFIALGAVFSTVATAGEGMPYGVGQLVAGVTFSLGLILVVVAGAELFTGNNLIAVAWASRAVSTRALVRNWVLVYAGNLVGAVATAALVFASGIHELGGGAVGGRALAVAAAKSDLDFGRAVALGVLCNALVCLAVWLCYSARTVADRILAIVPPIAAFVAAGFEHSVANMYFIPYGLLVREDAAFVAGLGAQPDLGPLTWGRFVTANLVPVTIGNVLGGTLLVAAVYWLVYLRPRADA